MCQNSKFNSRVQLGDNEAEEIIRHLLPALYAGNWTVANATDALRKFEDSVKEFGNTPWEHSAYFEKLRRQVKEYNSQIEKARLELNSLISDNKIVKSDLQIFMKAGGINRALNGEEFERIKYKSRYLSLKKQIESGHPIDPDELKKLNKYMINPLGEDDVLDKIQIPLKKMINKMWCIVCDRFSIVVTTSLSYDMV